MNELAVKAQEIKKKKAYTPKDVVRMFAIYSELAYHAGGIDAFGSEIDDPSFGALEKLTGLKNQARAILPTKIYNSEPVQKYIEKIEEAIKYCKKS
jgi:hypothetical protein